MTEFKQLLETLRWDDHRYYHHSLVNQSLHFLSAATFILAYLVAFYDLAIASLLGWLVAMTSRQAGHFFFEPKGFDTVNNVTHEYKEEIKVGYNLLRKWVLMSIWAAVPVLLLIDPTGLGLFAAHAGPLDFARHVGLAWLGLAAFGLLFRTVHLFFIYDVMTGLAWATKIVTEPFSDIRLYYKAPGRLLRGERIDGALAAAAR